jgi:redox-sensitive bicupin YhaK (pirin superfamily)
MSPIRKVSRIFQSRPTIEGAGVHLRRAFGFVEVPLFDPFLLLDDFRSETPAHYLKGFPWHPHRGIETITYILEGLVEHGDSMGNQGVIGPGDVQWMTAGNGIIHQEMPKGDPRGHMGGFQLWANLPASHKMMNPRYRDITSRQIPEVTLDSGIRIKVIAGKVGSQEGPVRDIVIDPQYLDVFIPGQTEFLHPIRKGHSVFVYVIDGQGYFFKEGLRAPLEEAALIKNGGLVLFSDGDEVLIKTGDDSLRFLLVSGKPIREPVAWYGPIVMNTEEELRTAFEEYENGTFLKYNKMVD